MTDFYKKLIEKSGFDEALIRHALDFGKKVNIHEFSRLFFDTEEFSVEKTGVLFFKDAFYPYEFYTALKALPEEVSISSLCLYILLLERSFSEFTKRIHDEEIFFDTAKRIAEGAAEHYKASGFYGLYDYHFLANYVRGSILRLGIFEYQYGEFEEKKCIKLHLPEKCSLSQENRFSSYRLARQYFGDYPIIAESWLLFPENKKMLSEDSRILQFMNDFDIISTHETHDYSELFHVFGKLCDYSYENLPQETSLQKAYAERVKNGLVIGSGIGVLKY